MSASNEHPAVVACCQMLLGEIEAVAKAARLEVIDDIIHRLEFERQWESLTPTQIKHMADKLPLQALEECQTDEEREIRVKKVFLLSAMRMGKNPPVE